MGFSNYYHIRRIETHVSLRGEYIKFSSRMIRKFILLKPMFSLILQKGLKAEQHVHTQCHAITLGSWSALAMPVEKKIQKKTKRIPRITIVKCKAQQ